MGLIFQNEYELTYIYPPVPECIRGVLESTVVKKVGVGISRKYQVSWKKSNSELTLL
jgi:hypothetical protein